MFKKFLVPVDGSDSSKLAYKKALELAKLTNAEIVLLQVAYDLEYYSRKGVLFARNYYNEKEVKEHSTSILSDIRNSADEGDVIITELILLGDPARKIINEAKKSQYDLIIMGTRGNGPLKGAVLGSVSHRVITNCNCPVMVVKNPDEDEREDESET
ncbi:MAG: universal stress protein [Syntrophomonadaceae bacterium]|jgi:nucleotide-binding universal stress UspA family protein